MIQPQDTFCERARSAVSLHLDGELSQLENAFLEAHLERCSACRAYREDLVAITDDLRVLPLEEPERAITPPRRHRPVALRRVPVAVAAALVIGAAGLSGLAAYPRSKDVTVPRVSRSSQTDSADVEFRLMRQGANVAAHSRATRAV